MKLERSKEWWLAGARRSGCDAPIHDILVQARELISDPSRHTTGVLAKDVNGKFVHPWLDEAVCWCAVGAVQKVMEQDFSKSLQKYDRVLNYLYPQMGHNIGDFNDTHPHSEVIEAFDKVIFRTFIYGV